MQALAKKSNTHFIQLINTSHMKQNSIIISIHNHLHGKKNLSIACQHATTQFMHPFKFSIAVSQNKIITIIWQLITAGNQQEGRLSNHARPKHMLQYGTSHLTVSGEVYK